jgi:LysR family transcriptional regulator, transcriptional activator for bauABCD operon
MEATHRFNLLRKATVVSQDAVATLILSGRYIGFLPDHYAASFTRDRTMKRIDFPDSTYEVRYVAISRRSPTSPRLSTVFLDLLKQAHGHNEKSRVEA